MKLRDVITGRAATNRRSSSCRITTSPTVTAREFNVHRWASAPKTAAATSPRTPAFATTRKCCRSDRDYSACSLNPPIRDVQHSFACGGSRTATPAATSTDAGYAILTIDQTTGNTFRTFDDATDQYNFGPTQFLSASGHALHPRRDGSLRAGRRRRRLHPVDVHGLRVGRPDRPGRRVLRHQLRSTATTRCCPRSSSASIGCDATKIANGDSVPLYIGRRNVEGGGRQQRFENTSFRALLGVRGQISENWDYDTSVQYSRGRRGSVGQQLLPQDAPGALAGRRRRIRRPARRCAARSSTAATRIACRTTRSSTGGVTADALNYLQVPGLQQGKIEQEIYSASMTGDLGAYGVKSPLAQEGIKVAFGAEKRSDTLKNVTDDADLAVPAVGRRRSDDRPVGLDEGARPVHRSCACRWCRTRRLPISWGWNWRIATPTTTRSPPTLTRSVRIGRRCRTCGSAPAISGQFARPNVVELFTSQGVGLFDCLAIRAARR